MFQMFYVYMPILSTSDVQTHIAMFTTKMQVQAVEILEDHWSSLEILFSRFDRSSLSEDDVTIWLLDIV